MIRVKRSFGHGACHDCGVEFAAGEEVVYAGQSRPEHPACAYQRLAARRQRDHARLTNALRRLVALRPELGQAAKRHTWAEDGRPCRATG